MIKRICFFTINFAFNRQIFLNFIEEIFPKNVKIFLFVPKECKGKYHSNRVKIFESNQNKHHLFSELRNFCRKNKIDHIFSLGALPQEGVIMSFASLFTKTKSLCHLVVNPFAAYKTGFNKPSIKAFLELIFLYPLLLSVDKFYVAAKDINEEARRKFFFVRSKIAFLRYPTDTNFFLHKDKLKSRRKLGLPLREKIILYIGRIEYEKGSDILLELAKKNKEILFVLIGQLIDRSIGGSKLRNLKVIPPQNRESLLYYYNSADLCVFPSRSEAGPSTARESMACGTQVLISDKMGPRMLSPPAIKSKLDIDEINKKINIFLKIPQDKKKKLPKILREFIINGYSNKVCKSLYINKLLN